MLAKAVQRIGAWGLLAIAASFGLFAAGYAFEDPGGWTAVGMVALFVVPAVLLSWVAWRWPQRAMVTVLPVVVVVTLAWVALPLFPEVVRGWFDDVGPVFALATGVTAVVLAVLGLRRPGLAGLLLVGVAVFVLARLVLETNAFVEGPGPVGLLATSGGVMVLPMLVSGVLLLTAYGLERHEHRPLPRSPVRAAHA